MTDRDYFGDTIAPTESAVEAQARKAGVNAWETEPHALKLARQAWKIAEREAMPSYLCREEYAVMRLATELEAWRKRNQRIHESLDVNWFHAAHRLASQTDPYQ